jgi:adenylate cyclase
MFRLLPKATNLIIVFAGMLILWMSQWSLITGFPLWKKAEGALIDHRYKQRGERFPDTNLVLVGVETSSLSLDTLNPSEIEASLTLQEMSQPFPWSRDVYAATLDKLMDAGAKVVVFDFVFAAPSQGDDAFAAELRKYQGHVVLCAMYEATEQKITPPNSNLLAAATDKGVGLANIWSDIDGVFRRGKYRTSQIRESSNQDIKKFLDQYPDDLVAMSARAVEEYRGDIRTPPYDHDNFINFHGAAGLYRPIPIETLFVDRLWNNPPISGGSIFKNKIVVVGPIAQIFQDVHETPYGDMPGPEIQIEMMATLDTHSSLEDSSRIFNLSVTAAMVILALLICLRVHNAALKLCFLFGTTLGFLIVCQITFNKANVVIAMMPPLFGFIGTGSFGIFFQYTLEQFEKRRYRNILDRYVSKSVAKSILEDKRSFEESLNGRKQSCTVLFSDIRGFTTMTEGADPEQLVKQLNEYFLEMVGAVLKEDGSLQKFIGDAIMAAWGDVKTEGPENDSRRAVRTALAMRAALIKLNERWQKQPNRLPLHIGVGINEGEMIVGNIGHPQRMEFTLLGDGVNLAARLESATKQFHADILIGERVEALTREHFVYRRVGLITFRGKTRPIETFDVISESTQPPPPWLEKYHDAIKLFRTREFQAAREIFQKVSSELSGLDFLCEMYIERCRDYTENPPPADWNGTFVLTEK